MLTRERPGRHGQQPGTGGKDEPLLGMTMFGVTTPCVDMVRHMFEHEYDCLVFRHRDGASLQLVDSGMMKAVLDINHRVCDYLMGGVLSAGEGAWTPSSGRAFPTWAQ